MTVVGVVVELLLTDSAVSKFVRSIYAFFILFVIVQPIPGFFKKASENVGGGIVLDSELLGTINGNSAAAAQANIERALHDAGFENTIVTIQYGVGAVSFRPSKIYINAYGVTATGTNIRIKEDIVKIVCAVCGVDADVVEVVC